MGAQSCCWFCHEAAHIKLGLPFKLYLQKNFYISFQLGEISEQHLQGRQIVHCSLSSVYESPLFREWVQVPRRTAENRRLLLQYIKTFGSFSICTYLPVWVLF